MQSSPKARGTVESDDIVGLTLVGTPQVSIIHNSYCVSFQSNGNVDYPLSWAARAQNEVVRDGVVLVCTTSACSMMSIY